MSTKHNVLASSSMSRAERKNERFLNVDFRTWSLASCSSSSQKLLGIVSNIYAYGTVNFVQITQNVVRSTLCLEISYQCGFCMPLL
jgi:hypothetical protein